jgi:hypothetical protein
LHFVNHRDIDPRAPYLASFPTSLDDLIWRLGGDYVQQFGIAGTDLLAGGLSRIQRETEERLKQLIQSPVRNRDLAQNLEMGKRVADDGTTLLVDYAQADRMLAADAFGHSIYTRENWLGFHAGRICDLLYPK